MAETIRDVVIKVGIKQTKTKLKVSGISGTKSAIASLDKRLKKLTKVTSKLTGGVKQVVGQLKTLGKASQEVESVEKAAEEAAKKIEKLSLEAKEAAISAAESFQAAGEGAFTVARGIAILASNSDEQAAKTLKAIANYQAAFDIFKGSITTILGVIKGIQALQAATKAAAAAESIRAAATGAAAAATTTAAVSARALTLALGPIAIGLAAVTAAFFFFKSTPDDIDKTTNSMTSLKDRLDEIAKRKNEFSDLAESVREVQNSLLSNAQIFSQNERALGGLLPKEGDLRKAAILATGVAEATSKSLKQQRAAGLNGSREEQIARASADQFEKAFTTQTALSANIKDQIGLRRENLGILKNESNEIRNQVKSAKAALDVARQAVLQEEKRFQTLEEKLGSLSKREFERVNQISKKAEAGEKLTKQDITALQNAGVGSRLISDFNKKRAEQFGAKDTLTRLRDDEGIKAAEDEETKKKNEIVPGTNRTLGDLATNGQKLLNDFQQKMEKEADEIEALLNRQFAAASSLRLLKERLERLETDESEKRLSG